MDFFGWFWLVIFFTWWFGVSADVMGRKFLSNLNRASPVLLETGFWDIVYMCGPSMPSFPSFPYLWQDPRILEREKRLAPLWSGP